MDSHHNFPETKTVESAAVYGEMLLVTIASQRERGQWAIYYTSLQSLIISFQFIGLTTLRTIVTFDSLVNSFEC